MNDPLSTYLNDHLAGAKFAIELLAHLRDTHENDPLGQLAGKMLDEINEDRKVLQALCDKIGGNSSVMKEAGAWLTEKVARLKLRLGSDATLGEFESLETLALGILGKMKLWQVLFEISPFDSRIKRIDFDRLIARAQAQHDEVEAHRRDTAKKTFLRAASGLDHKSATTDHM